MFRGTPSSTGNGPGGNNDIMLRGRGPITVETKDEENWGRSSIVRESPVHSGVNAENTQRWAHN